MNKLFELLLGVFIASVAAFSSDLEEWNAYKLKYAKIYHNETEETSRMEIFLQNKHKVADHNEKHSKGLVTYKMAVNKFSDLLPDELNAMMTGSRPPGLLAKSTHIGIDTIDDLIESRHHHHHHRLDISYQYLPDSIDWRNEGAVNEGKSQGHCGSCWAFSATGAIEGQYFRKTGKLIRLSEQNLVDCVSDCGCDGCRLPYAYDYVEFNGINSADDYPTPYLEEDGLCQSNSSNAFTITDYKRIPEGDEQELQEAIATIGPISVSMDASHSSFHHYSSGIYYEPDCSSTDLFHDVLVVGYGTNEDGEEYYIVKNWWSDDWGENGYFRLKRNCSNHCGIATRAMYPKI